MSVVYPVQCEGSCECGRIQPRRATGGHGSSRLSGATSARVRSWRHHEALAVYASFLNALRFFHAACVFALVCPTQRCYLWSRWPRRHWLVGQGRRVRVWRERRADSALARQLRPMYSCRWPKRRNSFGRGSRVRCTRRDASREGGNV